MTRPEHISNILVINDKFIVIIVLFLKNLNQPAKMRHYEGKADLTAERSQHKEAFYDELNLVISNQSYNSSILTADQHSKILEACCKSKHCSALVEFEGNVESEVEYEVNVANEVLVYRNKYGEMLPLDQCKQVSHLDRFYDDLLEIHGSDYPKSRTFKSRVNEKYGKIIPEWVQQTFIDNFLQCIEKMKRKKTTAGHQPILMNGFGTRRQVDLVDYLSMPDGPFRFLMNYSDHGIKVPVLTPLVARRAPFLSFLRGINIISDLPKR